MTEFSEGDLIEATKGDTVIRGRLSSPPFHHDLRLKDAGWGIDTLMNDGFTLSLIERAAPPLPTEPGFYLDRRGALWTRERRGGWKDSHDNWRELYAVAEHAPLTKLEPVADTARRFRDRVREEYDKDETFVSTILETVAAEFGVTE